MVERTELLAALQANTALLREIGLRYSAAGGNTTGTGGAMRTPEDVDDLCHDMKALVQEQVRVLLLNTKQAVLDVLTIYQGTINSASIRIAEVLRPAILANAPHMIVVHNHPSGDTEPSPADLEVTRKLLAAAELFDIDVQDHVVVARGTPPVSMSRRGLGGFA